MRKRKKRFRACKPDAAQALGNLTAFIRRDGAGLSAAMEEAFRRIPDRHEEKCVYGPRVLGKADCERKAFKRMAERLKKRFPRLKLCLVGDALYASRTLFGICERNGWRFVATFKEGCWKDVSGEVDSHMGMSAENWGRYKLGLRHWQPDVGKVAECAWVKMMRGLLTGGSESWRDVKGQNLKRA